VKIKKVQKKRYKEKREGILRYNHEIVGLLILTLGILTLIGLINENLIGAFGSISKDFILGLVGLPGYLLPPGLILYSILIIFKKNNASVNIRVLYSLIFIAMVSALIQTGFYDYEDYENKAFTSSIATFFELGANMEGGGIIGGIISTPFISLFKPFGTIIILTSFTIIIVIMLTNMSLAGFFRSVKSKMIQGVDNLKAFKEEHFSKENNSNNDGEELIQKNKFKLINFKNDKNDNDEIKLINEDEKIKKKKVQQIDNEQEGNGASGPKSDIEDLIEDEVEFIMKETKKKKKENIDQYVKDVGKEIAMQEIQGSYIYPTIDLLNDNTEEVSDVKTLKNSAIEVAKKLEETLLSFGVEVKVVNISRGPAVTRYELQPSPGVKVSKIVNLADDISLNLAASGVRIEAPIPGKAAIGIEVPNKEVIPVYLKEVIESSDFTDSSSKLSFAIGKDISGSTVVGDIGKMPHLLIAGSTGSGKSVCINSIIVSLLYKSSPEEVKLLMVDPKVVELGIYNGIPHLLIPVVTDAKKAAGALNWAVQEMVNRYKLFADKGVRDIKGYNAAIADIPEMKKLPQVVIIIDELADLMMVAPNDVEDAICRLAQMARAAGMHLVIATQRPSVDVITGVIKANVPSRIAFAVSSQVDSRTILDMAGAEKLLGRGDMLFYPVGEPKPIRIKGAFVSDKEVEKVVEYIKSQGVAEYNNDLIEEISSGVSEEENDPGDNDGLLPQAIELVVDAGMASVSLIQRKFKVGYARAARIVDQMEARGIVGKFEGSKPRQVLISRQQLQELQMSDNK